ncbi:MAG: hypothetical protein ACXVFN_09840 [Solirubrobacteraceae bacterium]
MASATITRPDPGPDPAPGGGRRRVSVPALALAALTLATLVGFLVYPTYPNYDSYYSLLWGRELLHGIKPSFDGYRTPTEHPLAVLFGALLSLLGNGGDRVMVFATLVSFVLLAAGLYRLARASFGWVVGLLAAALVCTRFDFPFLAARAYIDIPYLVFVVWAAALEAERRRRGTPVFVLLALAGLMRPEAWLLTGLYWLWCIVPATWPQRIRYSVLTAISPLVWTLTDWWATGHPLFSLHHTSGLAEELGRQSKGISQVPHATIRFLESLDKVPVLYAGVLGVILAVLLVPRRTGMPLALLAIGMGTFVLVGLAGLSVIDRYLLVPSLVVMIFAGVTMGGWSMLRPGRARTLWMLVAGAVVIYGATYSVARVNLSQFVSELQFRDQSHAALVALFRQPKVRAGLKCGPVYTPNHKLIPDTRWILHAGPGKVLARSDPGNASAMRTGVAVLPVSRLALLRQGFTQNVNTPADTANVQPPAGWDFAGATQHYGAYVRC